MKIIVTYDIYEHGQMCGGGIFADDTLNDETIDKIKSFVSSNGPQGEFFLANFRVTTI